MCLLLLVPCVKRVVVTGAGQRGVQRPYICRQPVILLRSYFVGVHSPVLTGARHRSTCYNRAELGSVHGMWSQYTCRVGWWLGM
jgi:hypothetical protein